jgi:hypothetical protein
MSRITTANAPTKDAETTYSSVFDDGELVGPSVVGRDSVDCSTTTPEPREMPQLARPNIGTLRDTSISLRMGTFLFRFDIDNLISRVYQHGVQADAFRGYSVTRKATPTQTRFGG